MLGGAMTSIKNKHTPGPWCFCDHAPVITESAHPFREICDYTDAEFSLGEAEANARLIAAAPELLAALKDCCDELNRLRDLHCPEYEGKLGEPVIPESVRAAIAKAEGRE